MTPEELVKKLREGGRILVLFSPVQRAGGRETLTRPGFYLSSANKFVFSAHVIEVDEHGKVHQLNSDLQRFLTELLPADIAPIARVLGPFKTAEAAVEYARQLWAK